MRKMNERTLQMIRYYKSHWKEPDCVPAEVAREFKLSPRTVYNYLQTIADELSNELGYTITREDLLYRPHSEHLCYERKYEPVEPINLEEFREHFRNTKGSMRAMIESIDAVLAAQDVNGIDDEKGDL